jgi:hypothetical protein
MKKLLLILCLFLSACNNSPSPAELQEINNTVDACTKKVKALKMGVAFSAYYDPNSNQFHYFGTDKEQFEYKKCLIENGIPLKEK